MKKLSIIVFCLCVLFISVNLAQNQTDEQTKSEETESEEIINTDSLDEDSNESTDNTFVCQLPPSVVALDLSQKEIFLNCPSSDESCSINKIIKITTTTVDSPEIKYLYTVSVGKIIGEGAFVEWDLSDVEAGSYSITAAISHPSPFGEDGWATLGQTKTKTVTIKECPNCK